jgi:hypothetical protein
MYTLEPNYYMDKAVFREDTFYLVPAGVAYSGLKDEVPAPKIFHWCPKLAVLQEDNVGILFLADDVKYMECDRCKKRPGDDIVTVYELLKVK